MTAPWSDEEPVPVTVADISALLEGQLTPEVLEEAIRLGYIDVDGERVTHVSRRLLDTTTALVREGIPLPAILATGRELQAGLDKLASLFMELVITPVLERHGGAPPPQEVARLAETIERLRPVARTALDAEFARAMDRRARASYGEFIPAARGARIARAEDLSYHLTMPVILAWLLIDVEGGSGRQMRRARDLAGQVVVITGAARGIGACTARRLAARNARVALLGLEPDELASVSAECGPHSRWWEVDVTDERALAGRRRRGPRRLRPDRRRGRQRRDRRRRPVHPLRPRRVRAGHRGQPARWRGHRPRLPARPARKQGLPAAGGVAGRARPRPDDGGLLREQSRRGGVRPCRPCGGGAPWGPGRRGLPELDRHRHGARGGREPGAEADARRAAVPGRPHQSCRGCGRRPYRRDRQACTTRLRAALATANAAGQGGGTADLREARRPRHARDGGAVAGGRCRDRAPGGGRCRGHQGEACVRRGRTRETRA